MLKNNLPLLVLTFEHSLNASWKCTTRIYQLLSKLDDISISYTGNIKLVKDPKVVLVDSN